MSSDIVYFEMADGTKVSNDPQFELLEQREEVLASRENRGDVGITEAEQKAQTQVEHPANLNSGQPGVGPNAVPDDPMEYIPNTGTAAMRIQKEDRLEAEQAGGSPLSTTVKDPEPVDSNEAVLEARKAEQERREELRKAQEKLGEGEPGDPTLPYSEWNAKQLKLEVARRNAERGEDQQLDISGMTKKGQVAELLEQDDQAQAS